MEEEGMQMLAKGFLYAESFIYFLFFFYFYFFLLINLKGKAKNG